MPNHAYSAQLLDKKVIIFVLDYINYEDLITYGQDNIKYLLENGAIGLMNTNTGGAYTISNAYATIGAGNYAVSSVFGAYSGGYDNLFNKEPINVIYKRHNGKEMKEENIANADINGLKRQNEGLNRPVKIGLLGSLLNEQGYKTAIIGNESSDIDDISINAGLITMNSDGITDMGKVDSSLLIRDYMSPFGIRTNYDALYEAYKDVKNQADFIVIQTGDTYRLNKYMNISDERYKESKINTFKHIDELLGKVLKDRDNKNTLFMLVVPFPSSEDIAKGKKLTPIVVFDNCSFRGILTSATTKRDGIITNTDLTAQVLEYFNISRSPHMSGHKIDCKIIEEPLEYLMNLNDISVFNYKSRATIVKTYIGFIIIALLLSLIFILYFKKYLSLIKSLLTAVLIIPSALLLLPLFNPWNSLRFTLSLVFTVVAFSIILKKFSKDSLQTFAVSCLFSTAIILVDTFLKNPLMKVSILGYDPIAGARFYGIGNEYMGFLLGTTLIGTTALVDKYRAKEKTMKAISIIIYIVVLLTLAAPTLGTNVGGSMAAFVGFGTATLLLLKGNISGRDIVLIGIFLILSLICLFIYDGIRPAETQSHIGQTSTLIRYNSVYALFQIFGRKLSMNYKLIKYSIWTWALIAIIAALGLLFRWPVGILKEIFRKHKYLYFGFISGIIGTLAAFAFNDSGVVAAAMFMIPVTIPLIIMCIDEELKHLH